MKKQPFITLLMLVPGIFCMLFAQTGTMYAAGQFKPHRVFNVGSNPDGLEIGDINGDGKNELVVGNRGSKDLSCLKRVDGAKDSLALYLTQKLSWSMGVIDIADINQDGLNDVVIAHYNNYAGAGNTNTFGICFQDSSTHMLKEEVSYKLPGGNSSRAIDAGDCNGDGKNEIVLANEGSPGKLYVYGWSAASSTVELLGTYSCAGSGQPISITIADADGDKKNDVVVHGPSLYVYLQGADGKLAAPVTYGSNGESADVGDFNGDGLNDIACAASWSSAMKLFYQTPDHKFKDGGTKSCGAYTEDVEVTDLNKDGKADICIANRDRSELYIFYQNASGGLEQPVKMQAINGNWLNELAVGDLNGDGYTDIAGSNWGMAGVGQIKPSSSSVWFYDPGTGTFKTPVTVHASPRLSVVNNHIELCLPVHGSVSLTFYDLSGKQAPVVQLGFKPMGTYLFALDDYLKASGAYCVVVKTETGFLKREFMLVK